VIASAARCGVGFLILLATPLIAAESVGPVDWQPCVEGVTQLCESVAPPRCAAVSANASGRRSANISMAAIRGT
jgi:hypothetical protein